MKKKNPICIAFLFMIFSLSSLTLFTIAQETRQLDTRTYWGHTFNMGNYDRYVWSFSSSASDILVLALTQHEYDAFYNHYLSDYSAILNRQDSREASGTWRPHSQDKWYILYINVGYVTTTLTIEDRVDRIYYFPMIPVIISLSIIIPVILLSIFLILHKKKQKRIDKTKPIQYCTKCGTQSNSTNEYCENCGSKIIPLK